MTARRELHPYLAQNGLTPGVISERSLVCVKCGDSFRLSRGGEKIKPRTPGKPTPASLGRCKKCVEDRLTK